VSIKDLICYEGHGVTAASKILENFKSIYSSTAVEHPFVQALVFSSFAPKN